MEKVESLRLLLTGKNNIENNLKLTRDFQEIVAKYKYFNYYFLDSKAFSKDDNSVLVVDTIEVVKNLTDFIEDNQFDDIAPKKCVVITLHEGILFNNFLNHFEIMIQRYYDVSFFIICPYENHFPLALRSYFKHLVCWDSNLMVKKFDELFGKIKPFEENPLRLRIDIGYKYDDSDKKRLIKTLLLMKFVFDGRNFYETFIWDFNRNNVFNLNEFHTFTEKESTKTKVVIFDNVHEFSDMSSMQAMYIKNLFELLGRFNEMHFIFIVGNLFETELIPDGAYYKFETTNFIDESSFDENFNNLATILNKY